jgi:hypothetical protein
MDNPDFREFADEVWCWQPLATEAAAEVAERAQAMVVVHMEGDQFV